MQIASYTHRIFTQATAVIINRVLFKDVLFESKKLEMLLHSSFGCRHLPDVSLFPACMNLTCRQHLYIFSLNLCSIIFSRVNAVIAFSSILKTKSLRVHLTLEIINSIRNWDLCMKLIIQNVYPEKNEGRWWRPVFQNSKKSSVNRYICLELLRNIISRKTQKDKEKKPVLKKFRKIAIRKNNKTEKTKLDICEWIRRIIIFRRESNNNNRLRRIQKKMVRRKTKIFFVLLFAWIKHQQ